MSTPPEGLDTATPIDVWSHPIYTASLSDEARFPKARYDLVRAEVRRRGFARLHESPRIRRRDLLRAHAARYVDAFLEGRLDARAQRRIGLTPWTPLIRDRTLHLMGGSLAALDAALAEGAGGHLAGGTHHAHRDFGSGYCIFNDIPIVARAALSRGVDRVLVVDLDVHQGDGTATILASDHRCTTLSIHCRTNFPFRKARSDVDIALAPGCSDEAYLSVLRGQLPRLVDRVLPGLVIFQAGVDPLAADHLGRLSLTRRGLRARNEVMYAHSIGRGIPTVVLMGGGYARPIEASVLAHADVFEDAARWLNMGKRPQR